MVFKDLWSEIEPLRQKTILVSVIKHIQDKHNKAIYETAINENRFARRLYNDWNGVIGIEPTEGTYDTIDYIMSNKRLKYKFYAELKCRHIEDQFKSLVISRGKFRNILADDLYPTFICMDFGKECYVYQIRDDEDIFKLNKYHEDWDVNNKFFFIPKKLCMNYNEFINCVNAQVRFLGAQVSLNQQDAIL